jgi:hypothetical protein
MSETGRHASSIGFVVALVAGIATVLMMAYASSRVPFSVGRMVLYAWVALPSVILCWLNLHCLRAPAPHALRIAAAITSGVVFVSAVLYADAVFTPRSSTASLVFIFLPAWSLAGCGAVLLLSFLVVLWRSGH